MNDPAEEKNSSRCCVRNPDDREHAALALAVDISCLFFEENDLDQIIDEIPAMLADALSLPCAGVCVFDESGEDVVLHAAVGMDSLPTPYARLMAAEAVARKVVPGDGPGWFGGKVGECECPGIWRRMGYEAILAAPLAGRGRNPGAMFAAFDSQPGDPEELTRAAALLGRHIGREVERKRMEVRLVKAVADSTRASHSKNMFLANMSHELRTPLNSIIGFSEMMRDGYMGEIKPEQKQALSSIFESGIQLLGLIDNILDLSKIESGHLHLELKNVDFPVLVERCVDIIRERAIRKGITLNLELDGETHWVRVDELKFSQVIFNLLENAVKFTDPGGMVTVSVNSSFSRDFDTIRGNRVKVTELTVTDTGIGIAPRDFERIFLPFEQVDSSAARKHEGSGLGLALCREIVALHGGTIRVESEPGKGASFKVIIPAVSGPDSPDGVFR